MIKGVLAVLLSFAMLLSMGPGIFAREEEIRPDPLCFGTYPTDDKEEVDFYALETVKWRVLEDLDGELYLLAEQALENEPDHVPGGSITWPYVDSQENRMKESLSDATLHTWLVSENGSINRAFRLSA